MFFNELRGGETNVDPALKKQANDPVGKPSAPFFHAAAADMGLTPSRTAMVGDDIESDVGGAQKAGLAGILVKTGMYRSHLAAASSVRPDAVVPSIADVPNLLGI